MIDLLIKQSWLEKSSESALEEFKSALVSTLNSFPEDRHVEGRWSITRISEGDEAALIYDERPLLSLKLEDSVLRIRSHEATVVRYDDIIYAIRYVADRLMLAVYSNTIMACVYRNRQLWLLITLSLPEIGTCGNSLRRLTSFLVSLSLIFTSYKTDEKFWIYFHHTMPRAS